MKTPSFSIKNYRPKCMFFMALMLAFCTSSLTHAQQQPIRTTTYFHHDASGSVVAATNEAGEEIWRKNYKPYGEQQAGSDQTESVSYTGHTHDKDLGLTYMKARYYDPQAGRFMGLDPVGVLESVEANPQMFNRYAYANNNPYAFTDPDGGTPKGRGDGGSSAAAGALVGCMIGNCNPRLSRAMSATAAKGGNYAAAGSIALNGGMNSRDFVKMVDKTQKKKGAKKRGPKTDPNAPHNKKIREVGDRVIAEGGSIIGGGGRKKERLVPTIGGSKNGRRPDVLYKDCNGNLCGVNVGKTKADGSPVKREQQALNDLNNSGGLRTKFEKYD